METSNFKITVGEIDKILSNTTHSEPLEILNNLEKLGGNKYFENSLRTNFANGIDGSEADKALRIRTFGDNYEIVQTVKGFCFFVCEVLGDIFLRILILCSIFQITIGASPLSENPDKDWIDGLGIVFAVVVVVLTSSITNYKKENEFRKLSQENNNRKIVTVLRNNNQFNLNFEEILVGDIIKISQGMIIPADGILIESDDIRIDESSITGESHLIKKNTLENCLLSKNKNINNNDKKISLPLVYSSTIVNSGYGTLLVLAVGKNSTKGKLQKMIINEGNEEESKTPLELKLEDVASDIGKFGMYSAILTFFALTLKLFFSKYREYEFHTKILNEHISNNTNNLTLNNSNNVFSHDNLFLGNSSNLNHKTNSTDFNFNSTDHLINPKSVFEGAYKEIFSIIILCITIIVVAIPEGLPLAVSLALSFSVSKMMQVKNLVRNMSACEVVGGANYICTDKTGTLTKNELELNGFVLYDKIFDKNHFNLNTIKKFTGEQNFNLLIDSFLVNLSIVVNNNFDVSYGLELDKSIFKYFMENYPKTKEVFLNSKSIIQDRINFNSTRKRMTTIIKLNNSNKYRVFTKGAAEYMNGISNTYFNYNKNSIEILSDSSKKLINGNIQKLSELCYRLIGLAYKDITKEELENFRENQDDQEIYGIEKSGFCFLGLMSFKDGLRENVTEAVTKCQQAGIKVIMVTGDNSNTALAIAKECRIVQNDSNSKCITGLDFYNSIGGLSCETCSKMIDNCTCPTTLEEAKSMGLNETHLRKDKIGSLETFKRIISEYRVFARTRPMDKYCLVKGLKELQNVVAVTGDGTNDAMALSKSDVGFAMGINGTDIAKNAADIILLDDNFASIVNAVLWGRNIFDNIRKFIQFQLSVNISAVLLVFVCSCVGSESPISSIQMLWLNMIMDSLGSLCLATEEPNEKLLKRKPYSKREYIINSKMWKHIVFQAMVQFTIVFLLYIYASKYIIENDSHRIYLSEQFENCFGKIHGIKNSFQHHSLVHYILEGKKSEWDPLTPIKRNLDSTYCFFYDRTKFEKGKIMNLFHAYKWIISEYGNTVHMTIIFNTFVLYALFNQLNSRILDDSFNIFNKLHKNLLFVFIIFCEIFVQIGIVQYGGLIFNCVKGGLTKDQWYICLLIASSSFIVSFFLKLTKLEKLFEIDYIGKCSRIFYKREDSDDREKLVEMVNDNSDNEEKSSKNLR